MIKVEAIKDFKLARYDELKNIIRKSGIEEKGMLREGDTFECTKELCDYLMGDNAKKQVVVKVIEIIPEVKVIKEDIKEATEIKEPKKTKKMKKK